VSAALMAYVVAGFSPEVLGLGSERPLFDLKPEALWLVPMMALSFFSCPFLDLTFHRARQALDGNQAKRVFALGFFGFFLIGIIFTFLYSHPMVHTLDGGASGTPRHLVLAVVVHMILQAGFTGAEHYRSVLGSSAPRPVHLLGAGVLLLLAPLLVAERFLGMSYAEIGYRNFLVFYGLLAPAFVWIVVLSQRSDGGMPTPFATTAFSRRPFRAWIIAVALALPCYSAAVLFHSQGLTWLGLPGVAVVLLVGLAVRRGRPALITAKAGDGVPS
jgi:hypothetical protein